MSRDCILCGLPYVPGEHQCSVSGIRVKLAEMSVEDKLKQNGVLSAPQTRIEDHPVYREMILKSFFDLAEHAMTMSAEQIEKAWEARVRLCRFAMSKAFPK